MGTPEIAAVLNGSRDRFLAFLTRRVGSGEAAEDILQAAFLKIVEKAPHPSITSAPRPGSTGSSATRWSTTIGAGARRRGAWSFPGGTGTRMSRSGRISNTRFVRAFVTSSARSSRSMETSCVGWISRRACSARCAAPAPSTAASVAHAGGRPGRGPDPSTPCGALQMAYGPGRAGMKKSWGTCKKRAGRASAGVKERQA